MPYLVKLVVEYDEEETGGLSYSYAFPDLLGAVKFQTLLGDEGCTMFSKVGTVWPSVVELPPNEE